MNIARKHGSDMCRLCGQHKENLGHVMGGCPLLNDPITAHHDDILMDIFHQLKSLYHHFELKLNPFNIILIYD